MNARVISGILRKEHKKFVASITDEIVRDLVDKNSIITGGCIASMLLNEPVNDFDYYFTNLETAHEVAKYYVELFTKKHPKCRITPEVKLQNDRVVIRINSDGVVGEDDETDWPFHDDNEQEYSVTSQKLPECERQFDTDIKQKTYYPKFLTANAVTLSDSIQLIIRFYGTPEEIHKHYDFIHCCNYWVSETGELVLNPKAIESILCKDLKYQGSLYPVSSVVRMRKFLKRGWHINAGQILKICFQISKLNLEDIPTLEEQLIGVDVSYFTQLIEQLELTATDADDGCITNIDGAYLSELVDKIFG
jgi:hypothetical protein